MYLNKSSDKDNDTVLFENENEKENEIDDLEEGKNIKPSIRRDRSRTCRFL
jgi:hypothetical protein